MSNAADYECYEDWEADQPLPTPEETAYWEAELAKRDAQCDANLIYGPREDPYGSNCELPKEHPGEHRGHDSLWGGGLVGWTGTGRNIHHVDATVA